MHLCKPSAIMHWLKTFNGMENRGVFLLMYETINLHLLQNYIKTFSSYFVACCAGFHQKSTFIYTPFFPLTSLCSLCCLIDSSSLRLSSLRAFVSSASSSAMRALRVAECSRLWASSLLDLSSSSWSSDTRLLSSWASMEPLGSLCKVDTHNEWVYWYILMKKLFERFYTYKCTCYGWKVMRIGRKLVNLVDLHTKGLCFFAFRDGLCEVRLLCCCFDVVSLLLMAQSKVNFRALIKKTFRDTYSDSQSSGRSKLVGPHSFMLAREHLTEKHKHWGK